MLPQPIQATRQAWERYITNDVLDVQNIRVEVANSWQRCRSLKVNPHSAGTAAVVNQVMLRERLYAKQQLVKVARPFMDNLYSFVKGSGFQVVLTDEHGFLLDVQGDTVITERTRQVHLCPGGDWSEAAKGTNAIGTAIVEKKPVQIFAWEHFCEPNHFLTCSAAPVFDPEGLLIGILDISGDYRYANAHTLGMVVAAVNAIENQLRLQKATNKLYMAYRYSSTLLESMSDGLVSIDTNGIVTEMNSRGGEILGITPQHAKGKHINNVLKRPAPMLQVLTTGTGYDDAEITLEAVGKKIYSSATLLRDDAGATIGAVAVLREAREKLQPQPRRQPPFVRPRYSFDDIIGESAALLETKEWAKMAAFSPSTVLLNGESGTGKELFAQAIHNASPRRERPFVALNCAALPESLIESELFGYEEGTFTGARKGGQSGKFELADGGTVFLDEIGDMPLSVQAKLLRVIQEKKVSRIGSAEERPVDIRIIAATHKDLGAEVQQGNFRQDLYYRLNVLAIRIPALRERMDDIPLITRHLARKIASKLERDDIRVADDFIAKIRCHHWPGNIRELENSIERAVIRAGAGGSLTADLVNFDCSAPLQTAAPEAAPPREIKSLRDMEKDAIIDALALCDGNIQKVSIKLGIGRNTLYRKIKEYGIASC